VAIPAIRSVKLIQPGYVWQRLDPCLENYTIISAINYAEIPEQYRHRVQIRTSDGIDSGVIPLPLLAKERIILKFEPASGSDASLLGDTSLYRLLDAGGTSWYVGYYMWGYWMSGPTYAYVIPKLIIGNETVAEGYVTRLGSWQTLIFNFSYADRWLQDYKGYLVGDMLSITLSPAYEPPERYKEEGRIIRKMYESYNVTQNISIYDEMVGQTIYTTGIAYYVASDVSSKHFQKYFYTKEYNPITRADYVHRGIRYWEVWSGYWGFYDVYANYRPGAIMHDHRVNIIMSYSQIGNYNSNIAYNLISGFVGSAWEAGSIAEMFNMSGVSTSYILYYAANHSIPVYFINKTNLDKYLPKLKIPDWLKEEIRNEVLSGYNVMIPDRYVTIGQWTGIGWAVIDPHSGLGAWLLLGGIGENTTLNVNDIMILGGSGTSSMNISQEIKEFIQEHRETILTICKYAFWIGLIILFVVTIYYMWILYTALIEGMLSAALAELLGSWHVAFMAEGITFFAATVCLHYLGASIPPP
jgi:hypothetical protein